MKSDKDSGFKWGPFEIHDTPKFRGRRPLVTQQKGGCVYYPYEPRPDFKYSQDISQVDTSRPIIHKGNHYERFTHPRDYPEGCEWYFWDNCLLPELMYRSPANPEGGKYWARVVPGSMMPGWVYAQDTDLDYHSRRVTDLVRFHAANKQIVWQDLAPVRTRQTQGHKVLLALPSPNNLHYLSGGTIQTLINRVQAVCDRWGWSLVTRSKPSRRSRENGGSIREQLRQGDYRCVVTVNSASGIECLAEGVPVVALGLHSLGSLATTWQEFESNSLAPPVREFVELRQLQLLTMTWHKDELIDGTWHTHPRLTTEPNNTWNL